MFSKLQIIGLVLLLIFTENILADQKYKRIENLNGHWKFNLGDNKEWASPNFDDSDWDMIYVPSSWEDEGYNGYNGYAWYRKEFEIDSKYFDKKLYLSLGAIDDVAEIYINGKMIATSGSFPPNFESAYNSKIWLPLQENILNKKGTNLIAVRVYDQQQVGGINNGDIGIFISETPLNLLINLEGNWKFKTGDNPNWKKYDLNDKDWRDLLVPAKWDWQGYKDYDGFAWYRITFNIDLNKFSNDQDFVVILGKIDDIDEAYLNETLIGSTGDLLISPLDGSINGRDNTEYNRFRGYKISRNNLRNGKNVLAVRVFDGIQYGGIYEGPIGISTLKEYVRYRTRNLDSKQKSFIELLFDK
jgi:beta-galactosidase/beta-glucuronidase